MSPEDRETLLKMEAELPNAPRDAKDLTLKEVSRELEARGISPTGFWSEDSQTLQGFFTTEFQEDRQRALQRRDEWLLEKARARELAKQQEKDFQERQEELTELKRHPRAAFWVKMLGSNQCPADASVSDLTAPLIRAMCRKLSQTQRLCSLDLSHSRINTHSGQLLAIALCRNVSIRRLELEDCDIGPEAVEPFGNVLAENLTICHLSLENNPLTGAGRDVLAGLASLAAGLEANRGLHMLNLWRTGLGGEAGDLLCKRLAGNTTILSLEVGCNSLRPAQEQAIHSLLQRNAHIREENDFEARRERDKKLARERILKQQEDDEKRRIEEEEWLERRKIERAEAREQARLDAIQREEDERLRLEEEMRRIEEEERLRQEAKKKKKKKGKGKKKK